jgi:hypothetical protein
MRCTNRIWSYPYCEATTQKCNLEAISMIRELVLVSAILSTVGVVEISMEP